MTKPVIRKTGNTWTVHINGRPWNTRATWVDAITHANRIAVYARQIRFQRDLTRTRAALDRMETT